MKGEEVITIEAVERKGSGKIYARKLRKQGKIPAVLLDKGESTPLELDPKLLPKAWKSEGKKFQLKLGAAVKTVTIKDLQVHPIKRHALHVDLVYA